MIVILPLKPMEALLRKIRTEKHNIFSILSTSAFGSAVSFVMVLAFANLVDAQVLGTYQYVISLVSLIGAFTLGGLLTSIIRAIGKKQFSFLAVARKYLYIGSLPALVIGTCIGTYYCFMGNIPLGASIIIGNVFYLLMLVQYRFNAIYTAVGDIQTANLLIKLYTFAPLIFVLPALFFIKDGHILAVIYFFAIWLAFAVGIVALRMPEKENDLIRNNLETENSKISSKELLVFGFHQSVITLINTASAHIDKIIIFQVLGAHQAAIYYIAISIPNRFRDIIKQFETYVFARFATHTLTAVQNKIVVRFLITMLLILPLYIVYIFAAPYVFSLLLPHYIDAVKFTQIYALTLFAAAVIIPYSIVKAHATGKQFYILTCVTLTVQFLSLVLGLVYGDLYGAVIGKTVGTVINLFFVLIYASKISPHEETHDFDSIKK